MHVNGLIFVLLFIGHCVIEVDSSWWYLSQFDQISLNEFGNHRIMCEIFPNLNKKQRQICNKNPELIKIIGQGIRKGISECQFQFQFQRWNCSTFFHDTSLFGKSLIKGGTRELAFLQAMNSAAAIYTLAKSCLMGHPKCGCTSEIPNGKATSITRYNGQFKWDGCEHVVKFSTNFVRRFVDATEMGRNDGKAKFTLHNNRVGRIIIRKGMEKVCKCHGLSGSCSMKTCWSTLPSFREIGDTLRDKFDGAVKITFKPSGHIIPAEKRHKRPTKFGLIYYDNSPDFCQVNIAQGSTGTHSRICELSGEESSCDILCCRGFKKRRIVESKNCECVFTWCCQVECKICNTTRFEYRCK